MNDRMSEVLNIRRMSFFFFIQLVTVFNGRICYALTFISIKWMMSTGQFLCNFFYSIKYYAEFLPHSSSLQFQLSERKCSAWIRYSYRIILLKCADAQKKKKSIEIVINANEIVSLCHFATACVIWMHFKRKCGEKKNRLI